MFFNIISGLQREKNELMTPLSKLFN